MKKVAIYFITSLLGFSAFAGGDSVGNGGHGHVCTVDGQERVELYDYFMLRLIGKEVSLEEGQTYKEKVRFALDRLEIYDSYIAQKLLKFLDKFDDEVQFIDASLPDTGDLFASNIESVYREKGCKVHQLAIQFAENEPRPIFVKRRYVIRKDLWEKMTAEHQAGLILHEFIYRLVLNKFDSSEPIQLYNMIISSTYLDEKGLENYFFKYMPGTDTREKRANPVRLIRGDMPYMLSSLEGVIFHGLPFAHPRARSYKVIADVSGWIQSGDKYLILKPRSKMSLGRKGEPLRYSLHQPQ